MGSNNRGQVFAAGALAGAAVAAAVTYYYCSSTRRATVRHANSHSQQPAKLQQPAPAHHASLQEFDQDEVLAEQLTRNVQFFGLEKQKCITNSFVVVIGLGVSASSAFCAVVPMLLMQSPTSPAWHVQTCNDQADTGRDRARLARKSLCMCVFGSHSCATI
jgi:hypothetical protein